MFNKNCQLMAAVAAGMSLLAPSVQAEDGELKKFVDSVQDEYALMDENDKYQLAGGFALGAFVEITTTYEFENKCINQAAEVAENGFYTYYYYWRYNNGSSKFYKKAKNLYYATFYATRLVQALNDGGCYDFDVTIEDIWDFLDDNDSSYKPASHIQPLNPLESLGDLVPLYKEGDGKMDKWLLA